jgi:hypothetical protein
VPQERKFPFKSALGLVRQALKLDYFRPDENGKTAVPAHWVPSHGPLTVVVGDNAGGKSFVRRVVHSICQRNKVEFIGISMEGRRGISAAPWLVFVYGDEQHHSTGELSAQTILTGIRTCQGREERHVVFWDEPDLGLSESWAAGAGVAIREYFEAPNPKTVAAFVVTHSRPLVKQLLPLDPHYLYVGDDNPPETLEAWIKRTPRPRKLSSLPKLSHKRFLAIQRILNQNKP